MAKLNQAGLVLELGLVNTGTKPSWYIFIKLAIFNFSKLLYRLISELLRVETLFVD